MNAPQLNSTRLLGSLLRDSKGAGEVVEKLYLSVLARRPRAEEVERINAYLNKNKEDRREAFAGVLWALMNSSEFRLKTSAKSSGVERSHSRPSRAWPLRRNRSRRQPPARAR